MGNSHSNVVYGDQIKLSKILLLVNSEFNCESESNISVRPGKNKFEVESNYILKTEKWRKEPFPL